MKKLLCDFQTCLKGFMLKFVNLRYYQDDPVLNPLTPWERPPLKNIFCIYGIDLKTEVSLVLSEQSRSTYFLQVKLLWTPFQASNLIIIILLLTRCIYSAH